MLRFISILLASFICIANGEATSNTKTGNLAVSYQTTAHSEALDRMRFLLIDQQGQQKIYPKDRCYTDDKENQMRMVLIEAIPVGEYTLKFLVPNRNGQFEIPPDRKILIEENAMTKVEFIIPTTSLQNIPLNREHN